MLVVYFLTLSWAYFVYSNPLPSDEHLPEPQILDTINSTNSTTSTAALTVALPPGGPNDLSIVLEAQYGPLEELSCLVSAFRVVSQLAQENWRGKLPRAVNTFRQRDYGITIRARISDLERVERRWVVWAIARLMDRLVQERRFRAIRVGLYWIGVRVGSLALLASTPSSEAFSNHTNIATTQSVSEQTDNALSPVGHEHVFYVYNFHGTVLEQMSIVMGTIGAIVQAASARDQFFDAFFEGWLKTGSHPGYNVVQVYLRQGEGRSRLSKSLLIQSMVVSVNAALRTEDFRALEMGIYTSDALIAKGGYFEYDVSR